MIFSAIQKCNIFVPMLFNKVFYHSVYRCVVIHHYASEIFAFSIYDNNRTLKAFFNVFFYTFSHSRCLYGILHDYNRIKPVVLYKVIYIRLSHFSHGGFLILKEHGEYAHIIISCKCSLQKSFCISSLRILVCLSEK